MLIGFFVTVYLNKDLSKADYREIFLNGYKRDIGIEIEIVLWFFDLFIYLL